jgi:hypothetical protein
MCRHESDDDRHGTDLGGDRGRPGGREHYGDNVRVLPRLGRSPIVPDIQHTLIHLAVLAACLLQRFAWI